MEAAVWRKKRSPWKGVLWGLGTVLVLMAVAAAVLFGFDHFSLTIQLTGPEEVILEYGETYAEPGASPLFLGTRFLTKGRHPEDASLQISGNVSEDVLGKYVLTYSARYLWWTATAERTVRVVDSQKPVITLQGDGAPHIAGMPYQEEGFTAMDNHDGDITDRVVRTEDMGKITYTVFDSSGNPATAERQVPFHDPIPPEIRLTEGDYIAIPTGADFTDPGFTAVDNVDGDLTDQVTAAGEVNCFLPGEYSLVYTVTDSYQNTTTVTRRVEVTAQPRPEIVVPEGKTIYLTFDDGPGAYTDALLDVLKEYDVKATFFVIDNGNYHLMRRIVEEGHSIGIHSVTHDYEEIYASPRAFFDDLYRMQSIIQTHTGVETTLMRFPGGSSNTVSRFSEGIMTLLTQAVQDAGFQYFDWNVDSNDAGGARKSGTVYRNVTNGAAQTPVSVVLQHDIHSYSVEAVEDILQWGLENGYTFLPLQPDSPPMHHEVNN